MQLSCQAPASNSLIVSGSWQWGQFMTRAYHLRANVTAYDGAYVALAEELGCELLPPMRASPRPPALAAPSASSDSPPSPAVSAEADNRHDRGR
jgi:hypothetical protein